MYSTSNDYLKSIITWDICHRLGMDTLAIFKRQSDQVKNNLIRSSLLSSEDKNTKEYIFRVAYK
jgi:hypothetical protein